MKKILAGWFMCFTLLAACSVPALSQAYHKAPQAAKTTPSPDVVPMVDRDAGAMKIFSNLGSNTDAYDAANGWFVSGQNNGLNAQKQDIAVPFKPRADMTATGIKIALQYYGYGVNAATVAIYSDNAGLPGSPLVKKDVKNFETFGTGCCTLVQVKLGGAGLAVKKGVQYWVVGTTDAKTVDSVDTWDWVWNDAGGNFAFQQDNGGWILLTAADGYPQGAVAVVGTQP